MGKKIAFFLGLVGIFICACWASKSTTSSPQQPTVTSPATETAVKRTVTHYFVPVAHLTSELDDVAFPEFFRSTQKTDYTIVIPQEYAPEIMALLGSDNAISQDVPQAEMISFLLAHPDAIGILPFYAVDFRVKSLSVNGISLWDKTADLAAYPFSYTTEVSKEEIENNVLFTQKNITTLTFVGEIILSRGVAERIMHYQDVLYPFRTVKEMIEKSDFTLATLEAPLVADCQYGPETMVFCGDASYLEGVSYAGIDAVSLAANHIKDYGESGISETITLLDQRNIGHFGAGENKLQAHSAFIRELNGVKFGFLGYNDVVPTSYEATEDIAGSAWANIDEIKTDVEQLKSQVDQVVLLIHWGVEYTNYPSARQKEIAHAVIDAGADFIIGDHPHWVQGVEFYKEKFILYGIGNFVFDQMWSEETRQGMILNATLYEHTLIGLEFIPTVIDDYAQPRLANDDEKKIILNRVWEASQFE